MEIDKTSKLRSVKSPVKKTTDRKKTYAGRAEKCVDFLTHNPFVRIVGIVAGLIAFYTILETARDLRESASDRVEERAMRAWENLLRPVVGDTGKGTALAHLINAGIRMNSIDLSCSAMAPSATGSNGSCDIGPIYSNINVSFPEPFKTNGTEFEVKDNTFVNWNLRGATIERSHFQRMNFFDADFGYTRFFQTTFEECVLMANYTLTSFNESAVYRSELILTETSESVRISGNVSGLRVIPLGAPASVVELNKAWAWADMPPTAPLVSERVRNLAFGNPNFVYCDFERSVGSRLDWYPHTCYAVSEAEARSLYPDPWRDVFPISIENTSDATSGAMQRDD